MAIMAQPTSASIDSLSNMATHAGLVDARHGTFIQAGRDQTTIHHHYHIYISPHSSRSRRNRIAIDISPSPPAGNRNALPTASLVTYPSHEAVAYVSAAIVLIDRITDLLMDRTQSYMALALEIESLQKTLTLTELVIQNYKNTPLGQGLANTITPKVQQCVFVLQDLFDRIDGDWLDFSITSVGGLWLRFWWDMLCWDEFSSEKKRLCITRQSLQGLLMALHSYVLHILRSPPPHIDINFKCRMDRTWQ